MTAPMLRFEVSIDPARLEAMARRDAKTLRGSVKRVFTDDMRRVQTAVRDEIAAAGLGRRLGKAFKAMVSTRNNELIDTVGVAFSKATYKGRPGGRVDILAAWSRSQTIKPVRGETLVIPLPGCPRFNGREARPSDFPRSGIRIWPTKRRGVLLARLKDTTQDRLLRSKRRARIRGRGISKDRNKAQWILIRDVRLRARLDPQRTFARVVEGIEQRVADDFARNVGSAA